MSHQVKYVALYERLSHDDEQQGESNSISHQKEMLEEYASGRGIRNYRHFTDDGISGTRFDRPGFVEMMDEINLGHISMVVAKDMSRYGRDHLKVGELMELLRQKGVKLVAINDGVDTTNGDDDFVPFRNIMNEWYAKDTSRKIRFFLKIALLPVILIVTVIQWFFIFLIGFSSVVFNMLAGLFLLTAVLSYMMGISDGTETLGMIATGFVIFMIPVIGAWIVMRITILNMNMRDFIGS